MYTTTMLSIDRTFSSAEPFHLVYWKVLILVKKQLTL